MGRIRMVHATSGQWQCESNTVNAKDGPNWANVDFYDKRSRSPEPTRGKKKNLYEKIFVAGQIGWHKKWASDVPFRLR